MRFLEPNTIESITILKDKSATDLYREAGKNGVMIITTKKIKAPSSTKQPESDSIHGELIVANQPANN